MAASDLSSVAQGLAIIRAAIERERSGRPGFGVSRMADELRMERSRVSRLTQELCDIGFLEKDDGSALRVGSAYFGLGASLNHGWVRLARIELRRLAARFHISARLSVRLDERVLLLRSEDGFADMSIRAGMITPTWCTGAGRALLWDHTPESVEELLGDVEFIGVGGPYAAHSAQEVLALMARDRPTGLVDAVGEFEHGIRELAVPVRDAGGRIVAALSVLARESDFRSEADDIALLLADAAQRLSGIDASGAA
ncbi:IclR family transcriptional regulator [Pseudarthrobacter sp. P1]|uniref:IclR family transcriptional regulator n=1 Tax=Pseudarthrobacter sp. P1 TaxID=3418418 RepID=UPI003CEC0391